MNSSIKQHSLKELKKQYQSAKAPNWLLQDTLKKVELQQYNKPYKWMVPIFTSVAILALVVILISQQPDMTHPSLKSPSLAELNINYVVPNRVRLPSITVIGRLPTIPKTPTMPKRSEQTREFKKTRFILYF